MSIGPRFPIRPALGALLSLGLISCGPMYETRYDYVPPDSAAGKQCLNQCLGMREMCRSSAENRAMQARASCEQTAMLRYTACLATAKTDAQRSGCSSSSGCYQSADTEHCQFEYVACYRNCGGTVTSRRVCVSGCQG